MATGIIFGSAIVLKSGEPMIVIRKPIKLPRELIKNKEDLELWN